MSGRAIVTTSLIAFVGLIFLTAIGGSFYTIDAGERGVLLRNGKIVGVAQPGLGFKVPFIDDVVEISVRDHVQAFKTEAYSRDQQPAEIQFTVSYRLLVDRVEDIYQTYGSRKGVVDRLIVRKALEESKTVFGGFNADTAIRERGRLNSEMHTTIQQSVDGPVIILGVQIEDIKFSGAYEKSIEDRMLAEVHVQRELQNLNREKVLADTVRTKAAGEADRVRAVAQADADAIKLRGHAEAEAIKARSAALRDNPLLIELVQAEKWNGALPTTMLPGSTLPFVSVR
jgi:regulator of protease activity HflC (stomatin/prohibitin superfamily)